MPSLNPFRATPNEYQPLTRSDEEASDTLASLMLSGDVLCTRLSMQEDAITKPSARTLIEIYDYGRRGPTPSTHQSARAIDNTFKSEESFKPGFRFSVNKERATLDDLLLKWVSEAETIMGQHLQGSGVGWIAMPDEQFLRITHNGRPVRQPNPAVSQNPGSIWFWPPVPPPSMPMPAHTLGTRPNTRLPPPTGFLTQTSQPTMGPYRQTTGQYDNRDPVHRTGQSASSHPHWVGGQGTYLTNPVYTAARAFPGTTTDTLRSQDTVHPHETPSGPSGSQHGTLTGSSVPAVREDENISPVSTVADMGELEKFKEQLDRQKS